MIPEHRLYFLHEHLTVFLGFQPASGVHRRRIVWRPIESIVADAALSANTPPLVKPVCVVVDGLAHDAHILSLPCGRQLHLHAKRRLPRRMEIVYERIRHDANRPAVRRKRGHRVRLHSTARLPLVRDGEPAHPLELRRLPRHVERDRWQAVKPGVRPRKISPRGEIVSVGVEQLSHDPCVVCRLVCVADDAHGQGPAFRATRESRKDAPFVDSVNEVCKSCRFGGIAQMPDRIGQVESTREASRVEIIKRRRYELQGDVAFRRVLDEFALVPQPLGYGHRMRAERQVRRDRPRKRINRHLVQAAVGLKRLFRAARRILEPTSVLELGQHGETPREQFVAPERVKQRLCASGHVPSVGVVVKGRAYVHAEVPAVDVGRELPRHVSELEVRFQAKPHDIAASRDKARKVVVVEDGAIRRILEAVASVVSARRPHHLDVFGELQYVRVMPAFHVG